MEITKSKDKSKPLAFDIVGITSGKLMAIHSVLKEASENGTLGVVGKDVLAIIDNYIKLIYDN